MTCYFHLDPTTPAPSLRLVWKLGRQICQSPSPLSRPHYRCLRHNVRVWEKLEMLKTWMKRICFSIQRSSPLSLPLGRSLSLPPSSDAFFVCFGVSGSQEMYSKPMWNVNEFQSKIPFETRCGCAVFSFKLPHSWSAFWAPVMGVWVILSARGREVLPMHQWHISLPVWEKEDYVNTCCYAFFCKFASVKSSLRTLCVRLSSWCEPDLFLVSGQCQKH